MYRHRDAVGGEHRTVPRQFGTVPGPAVVEPWRDLHLEGHPAADAVQHPHQPMVGGDRGAGRRHEVDHLAHPVGGEEPGHQYGGVGEVHLLGLVTGALGTDPEAAAAVVVEQGAEHAGRVEPREAEPVDRTVGAHQRRGLQVTDDAVLGDRRLDHGGSPFRFAPSTPGYRAGTVPRLIPAE